MIKLLFFKCWWQFPALRQYFVDPSESDVVISVKKQIWCFRKNCCRRFWHATLRLRIAPYVDVILHRGWFWTKSAALGSIRWWRVRSCWTVLSHVMWLRPGCLLQSAGGEANSFSLPERRLTASVCRRGG